jgi:2-iminobutanoate/2-iminopropanoate deaminase
MVLDSLAGLIHEGEKHEFVTGAAWRHRTGRIHPKQKGVRLMRIQRVETRPDPYEPFLLSQAIRLGNLVFVSGQAGYDDEGRIVSGGFRAQGARAFANLERALIAGGASLASVVKVTIFLKEMDNFAKVIELRRRYFKQPYPADTIVEVNALYAPEALIEIEAVAAIEAGREADHD